MNIELPVYFSFGDVNSRWKRSWVKNEILYMRSNNEFTKTMYALTYSIKGNHRCEYCGREISKEEITLDHKYPKTYGGPSITNNLLPSCDKCNSDKGALNTEEYLVYKSLNEGDKKSFLKEIARKKEEIRKTIGFDLPKEFVMTLPSKDVHGEIFGKERGKKYNEIKQQYQECGTFKRVIITDSQGYVLKGNDVYLYAIDNKILEVPVIVLENVVLLK